MVRTQALFTNICVAWLNLLPPPLSLMFIPKGISKKSSSTSGPTINRGGWVKAGPLRKITFFESSEKWMTTDGFPKALTKDFVHINFYRDHKEHVKGREYSLNHSLCTLYIDCAYTSADEQAPCQLVRSSPPPSFAVP